MRRCLDRLERLVADDPRLRRAVDNVAADCRGAGNPHGNIPSEVQDTLGRETEARTADRFDHFAGLFAECRAIADPGHYAPALPPPSELRRAMSLTSFVRHHLLGPGYDAAGSAHAIRDHYRRTFSRFGTHSVPTDAFQGWTGRPPAVPHEPPTPCWWTWHAMGIDPPADGETYLAELAVGEGECRRAGADGCVVEVLVPPGDLGAPLYKPSALDAFEPDSGFAPDLSNTAHGWTRPLAAGLQPRPELVSRAVAYLRLAAVADALTVVVYPCRVPGAPS